MEVQLTQQQPSPVSVKTLKRYQCSFKGCSAAFTKTFRLSRHLRTHTGERPFLCDIDGCEKSFACRSYLNKHKKRPHTSIGQTLDGVKPKKKEKRYNCDQCIKEFKNKFLLKTHLATHTGEKPFKCDQCDQAFALKSRLIRHRKLHMGYRCHSLGCSFVAEKWSELRRHVSSEHKSSFRCDDCEREFVTNSVLKAHRKAHKFECPNEGCDKLFARKSYLQEHVTKYHSLPSKPCQHAGCDRSFQDDVILAQHTLSHLNLGSDDQFMERPIVFPCRKIFAQELSGYQPSDTEKAEIIAKDKAFRKETTMIFS
ncbi:transcription factor IIIA-like isoform X2 [Brevipalpus obovatus]|uniref:transcription factor IIIA-like isoform X2 n=1 Tax=Brevipalpus obovatus TaxID=246614 RepID=UPI003D9E0A54